MLFFRSEEAVRIWCRERDVEPSPLVSMSQLWELSVAWYGSRLQEHSRRPAAAEMVEIFSGLGLAGDFWDPRSDRFGG